MSAGVQEASMVRELATRNLPHFSDTGLSLINPFPATPSE
jgi:hypothetical protein